jgi:hypothetical protein
LLEEAGGGGRVVLHDLGQGRRVGDLRLVEELQHPGQRARKGGHAQVEGAQGRVGDGSRVGTHWRKSPGHGRGSGLGACYVDWQNNFENRHSERSAGNDSDRVLSGVGSGDPETSAASSRQ